MLPLKMVRSLVLGETVLHPSLFPNRHLFPQHDNDNNEDEEADDENYNNGGGPDETDGDTQHRHHQQQPTSTTSRRRTRTRTRTVRRSRRGGTAGTDRQLKPGDHHQNQVPASTGEVEGSRERERERTPFLLFTPTRELIQNTYRLAAIARDIGMDLYPNSSLSHIIFSWPSKSSHHNFEFPSITSTPSPSSSSSSSASSYRPSFSSTTSTSSSTLPPPLLSHLCSLPNDAVPLPFPSLALASLSLLRYFVSLSKGLFKLVFLDCDFRPEIIDDRFSSWDCSSLSLISTATSHRIDTMDDFSRVLAAHGWTLFKTSSAAAAAAPPPTNSSELVYGSNAAYLFRKLDSNRVRAAGGLTLNANANSNSRVRELRLPLLDFKNVPLRILQYIILITDDVFILA